MKSKHRKASQHKRIEFAASSAPQDLRAHLKYNQETGEFFHALKKLGVKTGSKAGRDVNGYISITINKKAYYAHRLAWYFAHGVWPIGVIDHINGVRSDNRIGNLRDVPSSVNQENRRFPQKNNTSGFLGVRPHKSKWQAIITINSKSVPLGTYDTPEEAHLVYVLKKREVHKGCTL